MAQPHNSGNNCRFNNFFGTPGVDHPKVTTVSMCKQRGHQQRGHQRRGTRSVETRSKQEQETELGIDKRNGLSLFLL
jgi:hypothetical protein